LSELDLSKDKAIPKLKAYLSAIFNESEKKIEFLPCFEGYLVSVKRKNPICLWIHRSTVEGILKAGFNLVWKTAEEIVFNLIICGWVLRQIYGKFIPDPPEHTIVFLQGLHRIEYGTITPEAGATGVLVKGVNTASEILNKTGKTISGFFTKSNDEPKGLKREHKKILEKRTYTYIRFPDQLYIALSKEKKFKKLTGISSGFEFRTVYNKAALDFLEKLEKNKFNLKYKGEKAFI
jgi:hypothetical protein